MKFSRIALVGIVSLATVVATVGIAGAASSKDNSQALQPKASFSERQMKRDGAFKGHKGFLNQDTFSQLLNMQPAELAAELKAGKSLQEIATAKGIDTAELAKNLQNAFTAKIDEAVKNGKLNQEQAAKMKAAVPEKVQAIITQKGHPGMKGQRSHGAVKGFKGINTQIQTLLGMDAATLKAELKKGKSLEEIAKEKGVSKDSLVATIKSSIESNLDQSVKDQKITAEQAAKIKENLPKKIDAIVTRKYGDKGNFVKQKGQKPDTQQTSASQL